MRYLHCTMIFLIRNSHFDLYYLYSSTIMDAYLEQNGYVNDMNKDRLHHEIYLSDARKVAPEKWKTVIRHPIKKT